MSKPTVPDLKELFKQASEIAQQVPESMQEAAFNRAIDLLTGNSEVPLNNNTSITAKKTRKSKSSSPKKDVAENRSVKSDLIESIDSTQHPGITSEVKILERSLMVLQIARTDHGIDGLTPLEIADILTEKFRISTRNSAVSNALGMATSLVNRVSAGKGQGFIYKIMGPGEQHLAHLGETGSTSSSKPVKITRRKKTATKNTVQKSDKEKKTTKKKAGAKAIVTNLIDSGYFSDGRTPPEIREHLKKKKGLILGADEVRTALLRLVREEKLERDENQEGNYEYKQP